jgi:hypothetical protein
MAGAPDQDKSEQTAFANHAVSWLNSFIGAVFLAAIGFLLGPIIKLLPTSLSYILAASCIIGIGYYVYLNVRLGGSATGSEHRAWYEEFRFGFLTDNFNGRYAREVQRIIAATDRFFGDADQAGKSLFPRAFGLRMPAPLWTAASYDRCLLLALAYPLLAIVIFWAAWGSAAMGQLEAALGMKPAPLPQRVLALACVAFVGFAFNRFMFASGLMKNALLFCVVAGFLSAAILLGSGFGVFAIMLATAATHSVRGATAVATGTAGALSIHFAVTLTVTDAVTVIVAIAFASGVHRLINIATRRDRMGLALSVFTLALLVAILWPLPQWLASVTDTRPVILLYFVGLLTLVNAPFDWVAIGITRALMRRGQELGGVWPLLLALADLLLSLALLALLALAILWATELFNHAMLSGGAGRGVIDIPAYLAALADPAQRGDPRYYWLYAMLFSSQIPAIANFALGSLCLLRGLPVWNRWIAGLLLEAGPIGSWQRLGAAGLASGQLALASAIGLCAYYLLIVIFIRLVDPLFGHGLIQLLGDARIGGLLP